MISLHNKKVAIYGGSFDPIHLGHLVTGLDILNEFNFDFIMFIPANLPSHKDFNGSACPVDRFTMVQLAIKNFKKFICSDLEIQRGGISFTIDTVKELKLLYPDCLFYIIVGDDLISGLSSWKDIDQLQSMSEFICLTRDIHLKKETRYKVTWAKNRTIEISSTEIRNRIKKNLPINYLVTDDVNQYIFDKKLYRN